MEKGRGDGEKATEQRERGGKKRAADEEQRKREKYIEYISEEKREENTENKIVAQEFQNYCMTHASFRTKQLDDQYLFRLFKYKIIQLQQSGGKNKLHFQWLSRECNLKSQTMQLNIF